MPLTARSRWLLRLLVAALLLCALLVVWAWQSDRPVESLVTRFAPPPSQWLDLNGLNVHWRDEGVRDDPLPILLIHGTSASLHTWDGWTQALAPQRRVIRWDLPGFGLTGPAPDGDYHLTAYVRHVTQLMDRLQIRRAVLVGNSLGGQIAWATAVMAPDRAAALVLIDAAGYPFTPTSIPIGFQLARSPLLSPIARNLLPRQLVAASIRNTYGQPERVSEALIDRYFELTLRAGNREALIARFAQSTHGELSERISEVRVPTLIEWGGRDRLIPPENASWFARDIQGSEVVIFPELGHVPHEEDPAQTVAAAQAFLARQSGASGPD